MSRFGCATLLALLTQGLAAQAPASITIFYADEELVDGRWVRRQEARKASAPEAEAAPAQVPTATVAATAAPRWALEGSATLTAGLWSGNRRLDASRKVFAPELRGSLRIRPSEGFVLIADATAMQEQPLSGGPALKKIVLHEAYASLRQGSATMRLGPQIIRWGRADGINPTDVVSAQDYTRLTPDDAQQVHGLPSATLLYRMDAASVQLVWQPAFRPSVLPLPTLPGVRTVTEQPQDLADSGGLRLDFGSGQWAGALAAFHGPSKRPSPQFGPQDAAVGLLRLQHPNHTMIGGDLEWASRDWVLRGEAAWNRFAGAGQDPFGSRESYWQAVVGAERNFGGLSAFLIGHWRQVIQPIELSTLPEPARQLALLNAVVNEELEARQWGLGGGLVYLSSDLRWKASTEWLWNAPAGDWTLRPRADLRLSDRWALWMGADWFAGSQLSPLGRLTDNRSVFVGINGTLVSH